MPTVDYPDELRKGYWDKKKGALDGASLDGPLKDLQKTHEAVEWPRFADGWTKSLTQDAARLTATYETLDKLWRARVAPLRLEAGALSALAEKAAKSREAPKPLKDAAASIVRAAAAYGKAVAAGLDALEAEYQATLKRAQAAQAQASEEEEPALALMEPAFLAKQLRMCKADPERVIQFGFVDDGKADPYLGLHPRQSGRAIMAKIVKEVGIKTGAYGQLAVDGTLLKLVVEKKVSGLVKRIRIPIRASGFKIAKVMLLAETGETLDQDEEDGDEGTGSGAALEAWSRARTDAIARLKDAARDIAALKDPESGPAVVAIGAVLKQLTAEPRTPQQVAELVRYVGQDEVVADVSDFAADIRTPLLGALAQLQRALGA